MRSMILRPDRRVSLVVAGRIGAAVAQAVLLIAIANLTTIAAFGQYSVWISMGIIANAVFGGGLSAWLLRLPAEGERDLAPSVLSTAVALSIGAGLVVLLAGWLTGGLIPSWLIAAAASTMSDGAALSAQNAAFGRKRPGRATVILLLARVGPLAAVGIAALTGLDVFGLLVGGSVASIVASFLLSGKKGAAFRRIRTMRRGGSAYWRVSLWSMLQQLDVPIVGGLLGPAPAGAYAAAFRLASPVHIVTASLNSIFVPELSSIEDAHERRRRGRRLLSIGAGYATLVVLMAPVAFFVGPWVMGSQYEPFAIIFAIFFVNSGVSVLNQLQQSRLFADGAASSVARVNLAVTGLVIATVVLGAILGQVALSACGVLLGQIILFALLCNLMRKTLHE